MWGWEISHIPKKKKRKKFWPLPHTTQEGKFSEAKILILDLNSQNLLRETYAELYVTIQISFQIQPHWQRKQKQKLTMTQINAMHCKRNHG